MPSSGLQGPFPLTANGINAVVTLTSPGAYALGEVRSDGLFYIARIGRSDVDLNDRLHDYEGQYSRFKCEYHATPKAAFEKECRLWHDFLPADNTYHPDRPAQTNWTCPVCTVFD